MFSTGDRNRKSASLAVAQLSIRNIESPVSCFFVFALWMDIRLGRVASLPAWYLPLRFKLTTVMTLGLMTAAYLLKPVIIHA